MLLLARTEGIFAETAGGVTVAVARKLIEQGRIPRDEEIVICITGNGLKTQDAVADLLEEPVVIKPSLEEFEALLAGNANRLGVYNDSAACRLAIANRQRRFNARKPFEELMPIQVHIPTAMRQHADGQAVVEVSAASVKEALDKLGVKHPGITGPPVRERPGAPLRQRLPQRRGHSLSRQPADAGQGRRRVEHHSRRGGRLT